MTREEDLVCIAKKLDRMVSRNNTEGALDVLKELNDFNMTVKLLQDTRIGMSVNNIRKHCSDAEVIALAKFLIKDWKRLLEPAEPKKEKLDDKNGVGPSKRAVSPNLFETDSSPRREDVGGPRESLPDKNDSDKHKEEQRHQDEDLHDHSKTSGEAKREKRASEPVNKTHPGGKEANGDRQRETNRMDGSTSPRDVAPPAPDRRADRGGEGRPPDPREGEGRQQSPQRGKHRDEDTEKMRKKRRRAVELEKREDPEKFRSHDKTREKRFTENAGTERHAGDRRLERWTHGPPGERHRNEPRRERRLPEQRPLFERRGVMDSSILYPTRCPSPPPLIRRRRPVRPPRPLPTPLPAKCPSVEVKKDRKRKSSKESAPRPLRPPQSAPPRRASPVRRLSLEVKKERREPPDPNAPFAPLPFHLHPPPPAKHPTADGKKPVAEIKKEPSDCQPPSLKNSPEPLKKDRKDSSEGKGAEKHSLEVKKERKHSSDLKPPLQKKPKLDVTKEKHRKDSSDSKPGLPVKLLPMDFKSDRKDFSDSKTSLPVKRLSMDSKDRKDSCDLKTGLPVKSLSMDSKSDRKVSSDFNMVLPVKRLSMDSKSDRKDSCDSNAGLPLKRLSMDSKSDRKDSCDSNAGLPLKRLSMDSKSDRKEAFDSKPGLPGKRLSLDSKMDRTHRNDFSDSEPGLPVKRHSMDAKSDRKESTESKKASPLPAKKLGGERRESHGTKPLNPVKPSTDDPESKRAKANFPQTPPSPASSLSPGFSPGGGALSPGFSPSGGPLSPSFSPRGGPLSPRLATGDTVRDKCIEMLSAALRTDNDFMEFGANCEQMAVDIEDHIYQEIRATDMRYKNRVRSRISNLKDPKNPGLRRNVLAGYIEMTRIASMSAEEMASDELKQLRNVLTQEAIREHQMAKTGGTTTDLLQCSKCRKKNCSYNQVQTRSADEPMTTFVLCNECGNRWKFC
ncbi:transcription elongation factor A protein 3 isoform X2 [Gadus morhua]|uniref:transcription elongation factor A protein 3 isoform X2 n=1 Tax=Gadus morhua TaxID=8049 RepID=UPI0011B64389|nr:serine/arginine repetitive matrix protein 1-like isoform X2 [Gadus morhua]